MIGLQNGSLNKEWQFAFVMLKTLLLFSFENNIVHIYWVKWSGLILYIQHGMVKSVYLTYPLPSLPIMFMLGCVKFAFLVILRYIIYYYVPVVILLCLLPCLFWLCGKVFVWQVQGPEFGHEFWEKKISWSNMCVYSWSFLSCSIGQWVI